MDLVWAWRGLRDLQSSIEDVYAQRRYVRALIRTHMLDYDIFRYCYVRVYVGASLRLSLRILLGTIRLRLVRSPEPVEIPKVDT